MAFAEDTVYAQDGSKFHRLVFFSWIVAHFLQVYVNSLRHISVFNLVCIVDDLVIKVDDNGGVLYVPTVGAVVLQVVYSQVYNLRQERHFFLLNTMFTLIILSGRFDVPFERTALTRQLLKPKCTSI
ncbi:hypothetical protein EGR_04991 [Echinococcus granulosus]|uniref:Uncharacterized protein n=1 Tax=Echinococcus granulosus TaxID=6210 RepID=W6UGP3_ECHGR|nr:hypothetical protein EGR_04991 [Echinococcus granulosus]EUB60138.1 hypothetical protein EGR_04991 [Echinococcus granulosus]